MFINSASIVLQPSKSRGEFYCNHELIRESPNNDGSNPMQGPMAPFGVS